MKNICIFTHSFPYTKDTETYLETEIKIASALPDMQIFVVPLKKSKFCRKTPQNISIINKLAELSWLKKGTIFFAMLFHARFWKLFFEKEHRLKTVKNFFQAIKYYYGGCLISSFLKQQPTDIPQNAVLYSYWFAFASLGFALYKEKTNNLQNYTFISRAHGYDLFGLERNILIPYRQFTLSQIDAVYSVSKTGADYLQSKYPEFSSKIKTAYLGIETLPIEKQEQKNGEFVCISCSNFAFVKRVPFIFESLNQFALHNPNLKIKWFHFGDGKQLTSLKKQVETQKMPNITAEFPGFVAPEQLHKWYAAHEADVFINISLSEGLPVSLMEAVGYGIPILATDAGGNKEICNQETGSLLPIHFTQEQFEDGLQTIISKKERFKNSCRSFFQNNFNAATNYTMFYKTI